MKKETKQALMFITLTLLLVFVCWGGLMYSQEAVSCAGEGGSDDKNTKFSINFNMNINDIVTTGALGAAAATMVKYCPSNARLRATLGLGGIWGGVSLINNYLNGRNGGSGTSGPSVTGGVGVTKSGPTDAGGSESSNVSKYIIEELSKILGEIKEIILGEPIYCEGTRWNPVDKLNDSLGSLTEEEKFFIGVILLLLVALYTSLAIMTSIIIRLQFNEPLNNKYMEIIRVRWGQKSNLFLIVLFIMQWFSIIYSIYGLCAYIGFIGW